MINLDFRNGQPLYGQVRDGIKRLILCGAVNENDKLPSVRELALELAINPNTIHRAYRELEADGFIGTSPGKGVFVAGTSNLRERQVEEIYSVIFTEIRKLLDIGVKNDEIFEKISAHFAE